jgi:glucokinase
LGESFSIWNGSRYAPQISEGGHMNFAPSDERQIRLLEYLLSRFEHVSVERVCSGIGIPNIYRYLRDVERIDESPDVAAQIESAKDPTKAIVDAAFATGKDSSLCRATIEMFVSILGSEAGNLALKVLATGGIYLAGGVAVHTLRALQEPVFMKVFTNKGRLSDLMKRIPVHVIITNAALSGAAVYAFENLRD